MESKEPVRVVITGAAGQIAYSLIYAVAKGQVFGERQVVLVLLDIPVMVNVLKGVVMEITDCNFHLVSKVVATDKLDEAFKDADVAMLVGAMPRREGMERKDLLKANVNIFKVQGQAIDQFAKKTIKVVVVGNPANTNALICSKYAPSIPKENFSALTRLDQNRAQAMVAEKMGIPCNEVRNCIIWGNHSSTQFPDLNFAEITVGDKWVPAMPAINDDDWVKNEFVTTVQKRGAAVIAARKLSSAMSAANAIVDHVRDWWIGTDDENDKKMVSMGVWSDGQTYGIPEGIMYSVPVKIDKKGNWTIAKDLSINQWQREKMDLTAAELLEERNAAIEICDAE
ncbi:malate dehydrogenase, cytoplasmic-like [Ylistrum balloti]|uniref:malate dehydrogenase, cytoplasmic-like n=1 Tax=Ylistrum balloti TaxID=509963 RepID=UPI002905E037|nr:malate dehydrogenase, cytoplasmic-like [Ylistrum balloti]